MTKPSHDYEKTYLGDGVYAYFDGYQIYIYTSDGVEEGDYIALDIHTMAILSGYAKRCFNGDN